MTAKCSLAFAIVLLMGIAPALAAPPDGVFRVFVSQANPNGDWSGVFDTDIGPVTMTIEADTATGLSLVFEQRYGEHLGVEAGLAFHDYDLDASAFGITEPFGSAGALPIWVGLNLHAGGDRVDLYVGPLLHFTTWGDLEGPYGSASTESEFGFGAVLGLDVPFKPRGWMFNAAIRYMDVAVGDDSLKVDVNPVFLEAGLGYRW